ncbi:MAG: hypothetical protein PVI59_03455, partial [Anaerolineae bacterium]
MLYPSELRGHTFFLYHNSAGSASILLAHHGGRCYNESVMTRYPKSTWRLIYSPAGDGPSHMAVDEA